MPAKKPRTKSKLWVPEQFYSGSGTSLFVHPNERKRFRKGAKKVACESTDAFHPLAVGRTPFFFKRMNLKQFAVMQFVSKNGLPAEDVVYFRKGDLLVRNRGKALQSLVDKRKPFNRKTQELIVNGILRYFSKMHSLGVEHHHPGIHNIVFHNGRISVIDFKYAERNPKLNWKNPFEVLKFFGEDYRTLLMALKDAKIGVISERNFIERLIAGYTKMSPENKLILVQQILSSEKTAGAKKVKAA